MGSEIGALSSPGTTSYRLPIVIICLGLSLIVFMVLRMFQSKQTDIRTDVVYSKRRHYALKCIGCQKRNRSLG